MNSNLARSGTVQPVVLYPARLNPVQLRTIGSATILKSIKNLSSYLHNPLVCLTFDDGPDPAHTPAILDVLAEYKTRANFFVVGESAERFPALVRRMVDEGHSVGNHTYSHRHPWTMTAHTARQEVSRATEVITQLTGQAPRWFRPPHGRLRKVMLEQARLENMTTVLWSHSVIDWGPLGTEAGVAQRLHDINFGDIVLMHDGQRQHNHPDITARQLPVLLEQLTRRGILPVTLDQVV